ncbi:MULTISPECIES: 16S rRNA (adenine(1518)-N(6)/adenine(1519)-N(6))-dimethyltransferase RsmA [unclassified Leeuwenhoekiella]|uniref:16S rRNA (adenine(1518)-N(6)/adenine(1519)-N(6))- dimethyltransferase RsmA n=1 Tax=unclassified Leeuwenhoekiella TaxID=2615029 RepID=UPI000C579C74|nr:MULTISPECIES: 16S rRNA (adenine(1518)-N(6)/adenine(1519)-N(6))-dimethyltransferase RsmA [unclassified Leeuwenhoekiella]MAW96205.1 16S rRNA (adenine(1518)-N(6)/adenine(1519)-N(6))-dimethyltransferase [Leeuwenhoekiella sp.]MBA80199.1 16S rRNA (adenine(1518)-N(6)/adenine(1519)-N(6))-dimethyltransferase [Leeuwenhoekiella sp.]|tara:strand:+ start:11497 stop:12351 length:855 start_codon:yes stop_codon:yes gene_type:complete
MKKKFRQTESHHRADDPVKAKKHLGQHFLKDENIARKIAETLSFEGYQDVLEIGPGTGVLTKYLLRKDMNITAMDLDSESIVYLNHSFPLEYAEQMEGCSLKVVEADFLKIDLSTLFGDRPFAITGNFPYNISTQIVFKMLEWRDRVPEFTGMFQKEVAQRICEPEGSKAYGILSVLAQAFYDAEYLFTVPPSVFNPPPKVDSGVLRLTRKENYKDLACSPEALYKVVKMAFQQRRKTLRNSLKQLELSESFRESEIFNKRPEQLSVAQFIDLTRDIQNDLQGE